MANLKELRNRIASVSSTMQITSAMKMVSASKLHKAQDAIVAMRPYADKLTELLQSLSASLDSDTGGQYAVEREVKNVLVVAISSNRGLAGAFNSNIVKGVKNLTQNQLSGKNIEIYSLGKKASDILKKTHTIRTNNNEIFDNLDFENVEDIAEDIMNLFVKGEYDKVMLVYNQFKNAATQIVAVEQFLPIVPPQDKEENKPLSDYIFEPEKATIVQELIPKSLKMQLFKALRDSFASEHGARMTAMHKATDNATELRDSLKLSYNKARQAAITG